MIELGIGPLDRVMTLLAGGRETTMWYRAFGVLIISLVAGIASRIRDVVVIVHMAVGANSRRRSVRARERPAGLRVIELAVRPLDRVMALFARRRETGMRYRTLRVLIVGLMTGIAGRVRNVVVVINVAIRAGPRWNRV
jgi:hypothetical protein